MEINIDKEQIIDSVKDLYTGENKYIVWAVTGVVVAAFLALVVIGALPKGNKAPRENVLFVADEDLLIPDGPEVNVASVTSRAKQSKWGEMEKDRFLTVPGTSELDDLSDANDRMINDILNAAP